MTTKQAIKAAAKAARGWLADVWEAVRFCAHVPAFLREAEAEEAEAAQ